MKSLIPIFSILSLLSFTLNTSTTSDLALLFPEISNTHLDYYMIIIGAVLGLFVGLVIILITSFIIKKRQQSWYN